MDDEQRIRTCLFCGARLINLEQHYVEIHRRWTEGARRSCPICGEPARQLDQHYLERHRGLAEASIDKQERPTEDKQDLKFDFTPDGEGHSYISLDQARVLAVQHARDNTDFYGARYSEVNLVWEVVGQVETEDFYEISIAFRKSGSRRGEPGVEQMTINKMDGVVEIRQVLDEPSDIANYSEEPRDIIETPSEPSRSTDVRRLPDGLDGEAAPVRGKDVNNPKLGFFARLFRPRRLRR